jgi:hypothetical protein
MPATFSPVPVVATGDWITAGWVNTYIGDNMSAMFVGTTPGDVDYYLSSVEKGRLAIGANRTIMASNGSAPFWSDERIKTALHTNTTGHTYNSTVERDMPNSSNTITLVRTSTIIAIGRIFAAHVSGNIWSHFRFSVDGEVGPTSDQTYGGANGYTRVVLARKTGVAAGVRTIKFREREGYGAGLTYTVSSLQWIAIGIPE